MTGMPCGCWGLSHKEVWENLKGICPTCRRDVGKYDDSWAVHSSTEYSYENNDCDDSDSDGGDCDD
jgi:hypothetical protein